MLASGKILEGQKAVQKKPLLQVENLKVHFQGAKEYPWSQRPKVHAVDGVSFEVHRETTYGLVGESGSGKTTTALAILRLAPITEGTVRLEESELNTLEGPALRQARKDFQIIFQDPYSSLNPRSRAGDIVGEPLKLMQLAPSPQDYEAQVAELFSQVGLRPEHRFLFPHQFSGGQRQRIGVARALATHPKLIVCDEPVSALDVAIQAQILNLLHRLQKEMGLTYLFISHDLGVVQHICDRIAVMYLGQIVEEADRMELFKRPLHPYTWALLSAVPSADVRNKSEARIHLSGDPPSPINLPQGCRFANRCPFSEARCREEMPLLRPIGSSKVACHLVTEDGHAPHH